MPTYLKNKVPTKSPISATSASKLSSLIPTALNRVSPNRSPIDAQAAYQRVFGTNPHPSHSSTAPTSTDWTKIFNERLLQQKGASSEPPSSLAARVQSAPAASTPAGSGAGSGAGSSASTVSSTSAGGAASSGTNTYEKTGPDNTYGYSGVQFLRDPNSIKDSRDWFAGNVINSAIPELASDPEQMSYQWAKSKGYSRGVEGLLNSYADPYAVGLLSGQTFGSDEDYLGFVGGFNDMAMSASTGYSPFDPRAALRRVFGASGDINTDPNVKNTDGGTMDIIGQKLYGGQNAVHPSGQVGETIKFLQASLTGVMSPVVMNAYLSTIQELGQSFLEWKNTPEGRKSPLNFGNFILDRLGPNAGL